MRIETRRVARVTGREWGIGMTTKLLCETVREAASRAGIETLAPHDLRRNCARLCHLTGGELDQVQYLLVDVSIETTERYLGCNVMLEGRTDRSPLAD